MVIVSGHQRTCSVHQAMSALGQKQTFAVQKGMSALRPIADMRWIDFSWALRDS